MSNANAAWLYSEHPDRRPGDHHRQPRRLEQGNGYSDWNISYAQYKKGSAL